MKKYILLLFLGATITLNAQKLDVPEILQDSINWCWAASSKCVLAYYGYWVRQCEIVEYARLTSPFINYGSVNCCEPLSPDCNQGASTVGGSGTIEDILVEFGNIPNVTMPPLDHSGLIWHIQSYRPIIMRWEDVSDSTHGHAMVIHGNYGWMISYMDPNFGHRELHYDRLLYNEDDDEYGCTMKWERSITLSRSPYPDHCYNCKKDENKGEEGVDCGGPCAPCERIHAPYQQSFVTPTNNLPSEVRAMNKITAGNAAVNVLSGQDVTFITAGEIDLLPGFEVQAGGNFNTQMKSNIYEVATICGKYCKLEYYPNDLVRYQDHLSAYNLANVDKVEYEITNLRTGLHVHSDVVYVTKDGIVPLWDLITGESSSPPSVALYLAVIKTYACNNPYGWARKCEIEFRVSTPSNKSLSIDSESEETELLPPFFSPNKTIEDKNAPPYFSIIPNPNPGAFRFDTNFPLTDIGSIKVINLQGNTVYETQNVTNNTIQLPTAASGQFFVVMILKDGNVLTQKMVVQR